ncbi:MAG TPA: hypothetical protein P5079_06495, partial [Elusimicrobiota bacterium]|nr:hypothetical protein [Elusimicrobiota bacterium]
ARAEFLRETKDENWGDGLFDYRKYTGGVETEYSYSRQIGGRFAYDFYTLDFPNYRSLESSQDSTLARELAGQDVLNSNNHLFTLSGWAPLPSAVRMELTAYYNRRDYGEQPVVDASGSLTGTDRSDTNLTAAVDFARPWALGDSVRLVSGLQVGYAATDSNQNRYDARKTVFLRDYYDYTQMSVGPQITAGLANLPWMLTASGNYSVRNYSDRPIQDANGDYLSADTEVTNITTSLGMTYALNRNFKARAVATLGWSDSNQKYEKVFVYNYKIANYLFGFSYEY